MAVAGVTLDLPGIKTKTSADRRHAARGYLEHARDALGVAASHMYAIDSKGAKETAKAIEDVRSALRSYVKRCR